MTLEEAREKYPVHETIAGFYDCEQTFECDNVEQLKDMEHWDIPPFTDPQEGYFNFVRYMGGKLFECWIFSYWHVVGYLNLGEDNSFIPMTYSEDFGWEEANPNINDDQHILFAPEKSGEAVTVEQIAEAFDEDAYVNGYIFTDINQLCNFISKGKI